MSIPIDQLYHYINSIIETIYQDRVIIYRFYPHGSKKLEDLTQLVPIDNKDWFLCPKIICADQEPLNYNFYNQEIVNLKSFPLYNLLSTVDSNFPTYGKNFRYQDAFPFDNYILLHSEQRSIDVIKYHNDSYIPVYYWAHALISLDWFRYAQHVCQKKNVKKTFLIYNRAWSGTREYRLKFVELLIKNNLVNHCQTFCNVVEPELNIHYLCHTFNNPIWKPSHILENCLKPTTAPSTASATFNINDYNSTDIEVVLETLFDDPRLMLTEKILRPIALGQPFILLSTHGSLQYLKDYGFQTFDSVIDESYDQIKDPFNRMQAVIKLMSQVVAWTKEERAEKMSQLQIIADYNRKYFFSDAFFNCVTKELQINLQTALDQPLVSLTAFKDCIEKIKQLLQINKVQDFLKNPKNLYYASFKKDLEVAEKRYQQLVQQTTTTNSG
jgi:hypothetical protein